MSPKVLQEQRYNEKTDIWSLGCVFHQTLSRTAPFTYGNLLAVVSGPTPGLPVNYSTDTRNLVFVVLDRNQDTRPNAQWIFQSVLGLLANRGLGYQRHLYSPIGRLNIDAKAVGQAVTEYTSSATFVPTEDAVSMEVTRYISKHKNKKSCCSIQ
ncbi:serine/threonine-protein kinase Nek1-like [Physella acuta]|uniref:serine/threonine-protein kinase Nek1-like n=1 Tax=Physella acuta TaxID=109671 RepID=UPI0027DB0C7D|nr:serine/threonine-protein kinase Nek1-like [Physella acuta]